ncbi:MAG: hypothetical protein SPE35_03005, partial [Butyricicoccus sp.]|nr:hypothetical protein [Butyricicoccus sp.]
FCTERQGHYIHFQPIPIIDYLERNRVEGEYYADGGYHTITFQPEEGAAAGRQLRIGKGKPSSGCAGMV